MVITRIYLFPLLLSLLLVCVCVSVSVCVSVCASRKVQKKSNPKKSKVPGSSTPKTPMETAMVFKTYDKSSGVTLRSSKTKFPLTLGQRKTKTIEQLLEELGVGRLLWRCSRRNQATPLRNL